MKKYATVFEFDKSEVNGLVSSLEESGFRLTFGAYAQHIHHDSTPTGSTIGRLVDWFGGKHLYVLNIDGSPLDRFIEEYKPSARDSSPAEAGSPSEQ